MASTESQFHIAMLALHQRALDQCDYDAKLFKTMVLEHGGLEAARRLLAAPKVHDGLVKLFEKRRLDLTLEALVLLPEWRELFTFVERQTAQRRLRELGYDPRS